MGQPDRARYEELDKTSWSGQVVPQFGTSMAAAVDFDGVGGVDLLVGPGHQTTGTHSTFLFSYDPIGDALEKRAILTGPAGFNGTATGTVGFLGPATRYETQFVVGMRAIGAVFLFE
jgi:hypothetical protein